MSPNCNHLVRPARTPPDVYTDKTFSASRFIVGVGDQVRSGQLACQNGSPVLGPRLPGDRPVKQSEQQTVAEKKEEEINPEDRHLRRHTFLCTGTSFFTCAFHGPPSGIQVSLRHALTRMFT